MMCSTGQMRMWGFHITNNYLGVIGSLFHSLGIEVVLVEAGIFETGTMNKILSGNNYEILRCHTLMFPAMLEAWVNENQCDFTDDLAS